MVDILHKLCGVVRYRKTFAEVFPINIRPQFLASDRAATLTFDGDHQAFPELLFDRDRFAQIAQTRFAAARKLFLL